MKKRSSPNLEYKKRTWNHKHSIGTSNISLHLSTAYLVLPQSPARLSATLRNIQNVFSTCAPSRKIKHWPTQAEHEPTDMHILSHHYNIVFQPKPTQNFTEATCKVTIVSEKLPQLLQEVRNCVACLNPAGRCSSYIIMLSKSFPHWDPFKSNHTS